MPTEGPASAGDPDTNDREFAERDAPALACDTPLAEVRGISKHYALPRNLWEGRKAKVLRAVDDVSLAVPRGKTVALVGESGSGKTTLGRLFLRLLEPTAGSAWFQGEDLATLPGAKLRRTRRRMQIVFQNPYGSLNPRFTVAETIAEGPRVHELAVGEGLTAHVRGLIERMGLEPAHSERLPAELSGGERQRVALARALSVNPEFLVLDEITASLDVSVQAQILNLLDDLQAERGLGYLFICHDLDVVRHMADLVAVMQDGKLVEQAEREQLFTAPKHPYTRQLLAAHRSIAPG